jgi:hypothetical protein
MRKPVAFMHDPVDAALGHSLAGTKFFATHQPVP